MSAGCNSEDCRFDSQSGRMPAGPQWGHERQPHIDISLSFSPHSLSPLSKNESIFKTRVPEVRLLSPLYHLPPPRVREQRVREADLCLLPPPPPRQLRLLLLASTLLHPANGGPLYYSTGKLKFMCCLLTTALFKKKFLERGEGRERGRGREISCAVASRTPPTGDLVCNPGMGSSWGWNPGPFCS